MSYKLASSIKNDIRKLYDICVDAEIVISSNDIILNQYGTESYSIAWKANPNLSYLFKYPPGFVNTSPIFHYQEILQKNDFNIMLADGSLIQLAYKIEYDCITWHRLCYFPCPICIDSEELALFTVLELFDALSEQELFKRTQMVTYVRFDFDRNFSDEKHAHSHITFGHSECRVPVFGPISVTNFFDFIADHFLSCKYLLDRAGGIGQRLYDRTLPRQHGYPIFLESQ